MNVENENILCPYLRRYCDINDIELSIHAMSGVTAYGTKGMSTWSEEKRNKYFSFLSDRDEFIKKWGLKINGIQ